MQTEFGLLPDFLIVGAMKGGTTSLAHYLNQHPAVFVPQWEVHYFDRTEEWRKGPEHYALSFAAGHPEQRIGDKTPAYSYRPQLEPSIPQRIASLLPHVQVVWCLRDPVARAYSHYWHNLTHGQERLTFEQALIRESAEDTPPTHAYRERSVYVGQIRQYLEHFPLSQMFFMLSERLFDEPQAVLRGLCSFLRVNPYIDLLRLGKAHNRAPKVLHPLWLHGLVFRSLARSRRTRRRLLDRYGTSRPPLSAEIRSSLSEFYRTYNEQLAGLIGLDLSAWER